VLARSEEHLDSSLVEKDKTDADVALKLAVPSFRIANRKSCLSRIVRGCLMQCRRERTLQLLHHGKVGAVLSGQTSRHEVDLSPSLT